jgi:hypothetical protein
MKSLTTLQYAICIASVCASACSSTHHAVTPGVPVAVLADVIDRATAAINEAEAILRTETGITAIVGSPSISAADYVVRISTVGSLGDRLACGVVGFHFDYVGSYPMLSSGFPRTYSLFYDASRCEWIAPDGHREPLIAGGVRCGNPTNRSPAKDNQP